VNSDITDLKSSGYNLMPAVIEQHGAHAVFVNVEHDFLLERLGRHTIVRATGAEHTRRQNFPKA
jgi:hypothetical protein